ncbi:hypothetical protein [Vallitalea okinawensis]|uniref:hypothetical protein n=1 Tax=Vallitalea okinawensis TaxID=2078660 RepID=UPI000CFB9E99|nr:hypothetical protein [Vallitalea okinawensis]
MDQKLNKKIIILIVTLLIYIYGILIPIIPLGTFFLSDANIIRVYPHHIFLLKESPNNEAPDFESYMKSKGWSNTGEMESSTIYIKENSKRYIHVDQFIHVVMNDSNIQIYRGMTSLLDWSIFGFSIAFMFYLSPILGCIILIVRNRKLIMYKYRN